MVSSASKSHQSTPQRAHVTSSALHIRSATSDPHHIRSTATHINLHQPTPHRFIATQIPTDPTPTRLRSTQPTTIHRTGVVGCFSLSGRPKLTCHHGILTRHATIPPPLPPVHFRLPGFFAREGSRGPGAGGGRWRGAEREIIPSSKKQPPLQNTQPIVPHVERPIVHTVLSRAVCMYCKREKKRSLMEVSGLELSLPPVTFSTITEYGRYLSFNCLVSVGGFFFFFSIVFPQFVIFFFNCLSPPP